MLPNLDQIKGRLQKIDGYKATDGTIHPTLEKAVDYENELDFRKWAEGLLTEKQIEQILEAWQPHQRKGKVLSKPRFSVSA